MLRIGIIVGSTRPGRRGDQVGEWVHRIAQTRSDATYDLIDLADHPLPFLDEPTPPAAANGTYAHEHTRRWSAAIAACDGFVMITPEYNHAPSAVLKNAIDYLFVEWRDKAVGFVSYGGGASGVRAVEHLRLIAAELSMADVRAQVALSLRTDFESFTTLAPPPHQERALGTLLDEVVAWSSALAPLRAGREG